MILTVTMKDKIIFGTEKLKFSDIIVDSSFHFIYNQNHV
jgi:hypothetical protein